jgi:hypothetical protein
MPRFLFSAAALLLFGTACVAQKPLPWQQWLDVPDEAHSKSLDSIMDLAWQSCGGKEGTLSTSTDSGPWGGRYFNFHVKIDWHNEGAYPQGWPAFEIRPKPPLDFTGYDAISYWIRCDTTLQRFLDIRFILWSGGEGRLNTRIPPFAAGKWVHVVHPIRTLPKLDQIDRVHFFLCESDYHHGDEMTFKIGGFQLCNMKKELSHLEPGQSAMGLWLGERADSSERIVILDRGTATLPALLACEAAQETAFTPEDELRIRFHEVFSGKEITQIRKLGQAVPGGQVARITTTLNPSTLEPGYYLVVADLLRDGKSLLGGRVGSDDLYIRKPDETMTFTVLSIRTGMVAWIHDLLYGGVIGWAKAALPHVYDPLDRSTYREFMRLFSSATWKHTEGNEAGDTGLALAAQAFRESGDMERCRFAEGLMDDSFDHMIAHMQAPSGGTRSQVNELGSNGYADNWAAGGFSYDSNQMGEWMRALTYGIIYYSRIPEKRDRALQLSAACRRAADYLVAHSLQDSDGIPGVLRHLSLQEKPDGSVQQVVYHQEGRQCDVYLGRALAGLSYYAYAMQLLGQQVPQSWWAVMDNTVQWSDRKMKPNGWFDWQCDDIVEGGCHTFLGNIYLAEGAFGCYLADRYARRDEAAQKAAATALRAYRYVTDDCWIKGRKYEYPTEFWVGPYVYWLFTEYQDSIGPEAHLADWLSVLDRKWSADRAWRDFLDRPAAGDGYVGRATDNGMLNVAILGYLGIKHLAEIGHPLHWAVRPGGG